MTPLTVVWHVLEDGMRADVASCLACQFHHENGTVTLCPTHDSQTVMDVFNRLDSQLATAE